MNRIQQSLNQQKIKTYLIKSKNPKGKSYPKGERFGREERKKKQVDDK